MTIRLKRAYDAPEKSDGYRVLVDRLWPRGVKKEAAHLDDWVPELAPSDALRRWFGHDPERFAEFRSRYRKELRTAHAKELLAELARRKSVTLVYAAKDEAHNNAVVLAEVIGRSATRPAKKSVSKKARTTPRASKRKS